MKFEQPSPGNSKKVEIKTNANKIKEKVRNIALAAGIGATAVGGLGYVAKDKYLTDYSDIPTKKAALDKAKEDNKDGFMYKGKFYTVQNLEDRFKKGIEKE